MLRIINNQNLLLLLIGLVLAMGNVTPAQAATFRIATLSPGGSLWVETFKQAGDKISEKTDGRVKFRIFPGGVMGSEQVVLRKMRIGQLQGAAISSGALYNVYPELSLYSVPFLFRSYSQIAYVRERLDTQIKELGPKKGYVVPAIIGGGFAYIMSKNAIRVFDDLKSAKVWVPERDKWSAQNLRDLGINPIPLSIGDVLMGLETGLINTIASPTVVAIALQWHTRISHILRIPLMPIHGVFVLDQRVFVKLSDADKKVVMETMEEAAEKVEAQNLKDSEEAFGALKSQGINVINPSDKEHQSWKKIEEKAKNFALETSLISKELLEKVQEYATEYESLDSAHQ